MKSGDKTQRDRDKHAPAEIRFDDVAAIESQIREEFGEPGPAIVVTQEMIDQFATLTNDHQWIHIDVDRARRESPFGETIAHGFLLLSLLPGMRDGSTPKIVGAGSVINYGADRLRFIRPVPAASRVEIRRRIAAVRTTARGTQVTVETEMRVVGSEHPALLYRSIALYVP